MESMLSVCLMSVASDEHGARLVVKMIKMPPADDGRFERMLLASLSGDVEASAGSASSEDAADDAGAITSQGPLLSSIQSNFDALWASKEGMRLLRGLLTVESSAGVYDSFDDVLATFVSAIPRMPEEATIQLLSCVGSLFSTPALAQVPEDRALSIMASCFALVTVHLDKLSATKEGVVFIQSLCSYVRDSALRRAPKTCDAYDASVAELARLVNSRAGTLQKTGSGAELARWMEDSLNRSSVGAVSAAKK